MNAYNRFHMAISWHIKYSVRRCFCYYYQIAFTAVVIYTEEYDESLHIGRTQ